MTPAITPELRERAGKDRPIIFSAPMVRALIEGRKTQTRRIIRDTVPEAPGMDHVHPKNQIRHAAPYLDAYCGQPRTPANPRGMGEWWCWWTRDDRAGPQFKVGFKPGDRLWVRETWQTGSGYAGPQVAYRATEDAHDIDAWDGEDEGAGPSFNYDRLPGLKWHTWLPDLLSGAEGAWRSPIHMPRALSRITLEVTEVRVERLQDISDEDVRAEGALRPATNLETGHDGYWSGKPAEARFVLTRREAFAGLWNSIHGKDVWDANPWVAAISFRTILANIDAPPASPLATGEAA